jgi:hypothetical protein
MPRQQESRAAQRDKWRRTRRTGRLLHCPRAGQDRAELDRVGVLQGASRLSRCADSPRNGSQSIRSNGFRSLLRHARGARGARGAGRPDSQPDRPAAASRSSAACTRLNCRTEATLDETGRVHWSRDVRGKKLYSCERQHSLLPVSSRAKYLRDGQSVAEIAELAEHRGSLRSWQVLIGPGCRRRRTSSSTTRHTTRESIVTYLPR